MRSTASLGEARFRSVPVVEVTVMSGEDKGKTALLEAGTLVVGSDPGCGLVLSDETVSARHCELSVSPSGVMVRDLSSTNGVRAGTVWVKEGHVEPGTRLLLGKTELKVQPTGRARVAVSPSSRFGELRGTSTPMRVLFAELEAVAKSNAPLLIEGETGTGKDLCATSVHLASARAKKPAIVFDCASVAASVLEAELFGAERGAFTGAVTAREGLAEAADGGTLVIDEIGELPEAAQPRLLRLLENKEVRRVGSTAARKVDVRVIACTNRSLKREVAAGRFREDLYYRLSALKVTVPSLRQRLEDLPVLTDVLLERAGSSTRWADLSESTRALLGAHRWPGNVRELRNVVERLLAFPTGSSQPLLDTDTGPGPLPASTEGAFLSLPQARAKAADEFERRYLSELMQRAGGGVTAGAKLAGVSRQLIQRMLRKHNIR